MKIIITLLVYGSFLLLSCSSQENQKVRTTKIRNEDSPPNVIVIITDDMGYNDVGFNGGTEIPTPHIDRIAQNGMVFTNGYVSYAVCGPSRAGLVTGRYQGRFGFSRNPLLAPNDINQGLPLSEQMLSEALDERGYQNMAIGKWHLGAHELQRPLNRGFDEFFGFLSGGHQYFPENLVLNDLSELKSQNDGYKTKLLRNHERINETEYLTDALSREAVNFIDRNKEQPFFLYLAYNAPHAPMQATEKYLNRFNHIENKKRRTYAAMVSAVDDGVGNILDKINELDIEENTLIFFLSDNGGPEKVNASDNGPLREGKGSLYEGGVRVPFAVQWKGKIPEGQKYNHPVISLDIFATVAEISNTNPKNELDGVNLMPFLTGKKQGFPHENLFWRKFDQNWTAVRSGEKKYLIREDVKETYNISIDLGESNNLFSAGNDWDPTVENALESWINQMIDPVFLGLRDGKEYNELNPNRFEIEKY